MGKYFSDKKTLSLLPISFNTHTQSFASVCVCVCVSTQHHPLVAMCQKCTLVSRELLDSRSSCTNSTALIQEISGMPRPEHRQQQPSSGYDCKIAATMLPGCRLELTLVDRCVQGRSCSHHRLREMFELHQSFSDRKDFTSDATLMFLNTEEPNEKKCPFGQIVKKNRREIFIF